MVDDKKDYKSFTWMKRAADLSSHPKISGFDFGKKFDFSSFVDSFYTTGFQATNLGRAIQITNKMIDSSATIFLSFTGNVISSGLREVITYLVKHKLVDVIVTSAAAVEEDIIKSLSDFRMGSFESSGRSLFEHGIGRIGNIFVPNDRYLFFEEFINSIFPKIYDEQNKRGHPLNPSELADIFGTAIDNEESFLYWCSKNEIPVFCPGIVDGALGDVFYFKKKNFPDFFIDVISDHKKLIDFTLQQESTGVIVLGGGVPKHYSLNSQIFREGADFGVYLTTASDFDGSDSGGNQEEAKSWAKIKIDAQHVKVVCDFTISFPLLVAGSFAKVKKL